MEVERKALLKYHDFGVPTYKLPAGLHVCATCPSPGLFYVEDEG